METRRTKTNQGGKSTARAYGNGGNYGKNGKKRQKRSTAIQTSPCKPHSAECAKRLYSLCQLEITIMDKYKNGVICYLSDLDEKTIRLVLDDVVATECNDVKKWKRNILYTQKDYEKKEFENLNLSEKEMADFGYSVLARLLALKEHPIKG